MTRIIVLAKAPEPGRVKTRLSPPCTPHEAAAVARAALHDTLDAVRRVPDARPVLALDGRMPVPAGLDVIPQRGRGLDERLAAAFDDAGGPAVLIGMDTPQITPGILRRCLAALRRADAILGAAHDGGWWAAGLRRPDPRAFLGLPMSTPFTGAAQAARFHALGLRVAALPAMRDVDTFADARHVAHQTPASRFAASVSAVSRRLDAERSCAG